MRSRSISLAMIAIGLMFAVSVPLPSTAQNITLGGDDEEIFRVLRSSGYTNAVITQRGLTIIRTEACKDGQKYQVKVSILGKITSERNIGTCPVVRPARFTRRDAIKFLREDGYADIEAKSAGTIVVATACQNDRRYEIEFNRRGKITKRQSLGPCRVAGIGKDEITRILREKGYRGIVITDDRLPRYQAEACRRETRFRIDLNGQGQIRTERRIGECRQAVDVARLPALLEDRGYSRIQIVHRQRPPYTARACKGSDRLELSIDRYGRVQKETRTGPCRRPIDPDNLAKIVRQEGYDRIRILRGHRSPYLVEACKGRTLMELTVSRFGRISREERVGRCVNPVTQESLTKKLKGAGYLNVAVRRTGSGWTADVCSDRVKKILIINRRGDTVRERRSGACTSDSVVNILQTLERRGANSVSMFAEGCFQGNKFRWSYDRLGNRTGRRAIGKC